MTYWINDTQLWYQYIFSENYIKEHFEIKMIMRTIIAIMVAMAIVGNVSMSSLSPSTIDFSKIDCEKVAYSAKCTSLWSTIGREQSRTIQTFWYWKSSGPFAWHDWCSEKRKLEITIIFYFEKTIVGYQIWMYNSDYVSTVRYFYPRQFMPRQLIVCDRAFLACPNY